MSNKIRPCTCLVATGEPTDGVLPVRTGCGRTTHGEFAPGHDAQLKSLLIKAHRAGQTIQITGMLGEVSEPTTPLSLAADRGWERFLAVEPKAKATPSQRKAAEAERLSAEVNSWTTAA